MLEFYFCWQEICLTKKMSDDKVICLVLHILTFDGNFIIVK